MLGLQLSGQAIYSDPKHQDSNARPAASRLSPAERVWRSTDTSTWRYPRLNECPVSSGYHIGRTGFQDLSYRDLTLSILTSGAVFCLLGNNVFRYAVLTIVTSEFIFIPMKTKTESSPALFPPQPLWLGNAHGCPPFDVLNSMLYEAVSAQPSNSDKRQIIGKLMLIGRTYSASVERRKTQGHIKDERQALEVIIEAAQAIAASRCSALLDNIGMNEKLTHESLPKVVTIHLELCQALAKANNRENSSLASKYLHFHRPDFFPIVDSYVREGWSWIMEELGQSYKGWRVFGKVNRYGDWCTRVLDLQKSIESCHENAVSLRQIDNYLLSIMSLDGKGGWGLPRLPG